MKRIKIQTLFLYYKCRYQTLFKLNVRKKEKKMFRIQYFMLINPLMTGGPINELNAGHGVDYCRIFMSGGD